MHWCPMNHADGWRVEDGDDGNYAEPKKHKSCSRRCRESVRIADVASLAIPKISSAWQAC